MKRFLVLVCVALIGLVAGAIVTGRPQTVTRDVRSGDIRPTTSTVLSTTVPRTTVPRTTTTSTSTSTSTEPPTTTEPPTSTEPPTTSGPSTTARPPATSRPSAVGSTETPATAGPTTTLTPIASVYVMVGNASNTFGLATQTATALRGLGYELVYRADGIREMRQTFVYYSEGLEGEALRIADSIGLDSSRVETRPSEPLTTGTQEFQVLVLLGNDWHTVTDLGVLVDIEPPTTGQSLLQTP